MLNGTRCMNPRRAVIGLLVMPSLLMLPRAAAAQGAAETGCVSATGPDVATGQSSFATDSGAALRILAQVSADEVRFASSPTICVRLRGDARLDSVHVVARRNLTSPVVAGTTYRNVFVAVEILGHLNAECIAPRITRVPTDTASRPPCASLESRSTRGSSPPDNERR